MFQHWPLLPWLFLACKLLIFYLLLATFTLVFIGVQLWVLCVGMRAQALPTPLK